MEGKWCPLLRPDVVLEQHWRREEGAGICFGLVMLGALPCLTVREPLGLRLHLGWCPFWKA